MLLSELKTIDIQALEWFDKINGNSYFACRITLNYGMQNETEIKVPFQYGYGNQYEHESYREIEKFFKLEKEAFYWNFINENKIIVRKSKHKALKRELKNI